MVLQKPLEGNASRRMELSVVTKTAKCLTKGQLGLSISVFIGFKY